MASKSALFFALLFIATASMANAVIVDGTSFKVSGSLDCSGTAIGGTEVFLSLSGNPESVASAWTSASGDFTIDYLSPTQVPFDTAKAVAYVSSPVANCDSYSQQNTYAYAPLTFANSEGGVALFTAGDFTYRI